MEEIGQTSRVRWFVLFFLFLTIIPLGLIAIFWIFGPIQGPFMQMVMGAGIERGFYPNYISIDLISYFTGAGSYVQSPHYDSLQKVNYILGSQVFSVASFDHATGGTNWNLSIGAIIAVGIIASAYHLAAHFNVLIATIKNHKSRKAQGKVASVAAPICATGGNVGNAFVTTAIPLACCGGTGVMLLLFSLAGLGAVAGYFLGILDKYFGLAFAVPTTAFIFILTLYMTKRLGVLQIRKEYDSGRNKVSSILKLTLYPLTSVLFIGLLAVGLYAYLVQSGGSRYLGYDPAMFVSLAPAAVLLIGATIMESKKLEGT